MTSKVADPAFDVADEAALRALYPPTHAIAQLKCVDRIDAHARAFIARAPFLCIGTHDAAGGADVSPRGDAPGFVRVCDDRTLLIPDRPGNNRLDTQANVLATGSVGLLFMVPGFDDTLRVNGRATITRDPALLAGSAVAGKVPVTGIVVEVREVFLHCAKAFRRARLWDPDAAQDRGEMPSLIAMIRAQTGDAPLDAGAQAAADAALEDDYRQSMY